MNVERLLAIGGIGLSLLGIATPFIWKTMPEIISYPMALLGLAIFAWCVVHLVRGFKPSLRLEIYDHVEPKRAPGRAERTWRVRVINDSAVSAKGCTVRQRSFINNRGDESRHPGIQFRAPFDLHARTTEDVNIAFLNEREPDGRVHMFYNGRTNLIEKRMFPHTLILEVSAENLPNPIDLKCVLSVDGRGYLQMVSS